MKNNDFLNKKLIVGTLDVNDSSLLYNGMTKTGINGPATLSNYIVENKIDILGTQGMTKGYINNLSKEVKQYSIVGDRRYKLNPFSNESNSIITPHEVLEVNTGHLTSNPKSLLYIFNIEERVVTYSLIRLDNNQQVIAINTKLSSPKSNLNKSPIIDDFNDKIKELQNEQLNEILYLVEVLRQMYPSFPLVLTGNFNMVWYDYFFKKFVNNLEKYNITKVGSDMISEMGKDYIFYSESLLSLKDYSFGDSVLDKTSKHKVLLSTFEFKNHCRY